MRPGNPVRILLRLLGLVLFVASLVAVVVIVAVAPDDIGREMGKNCRHTDNGPSEWCTWQDVLGILQALPWITLIGAVLVLAMRPGWVGRSRRSEPRPPMWATGASARSARSP